MNNVTLTGRLTATPELRTSAKGNAYCYFTIAVNRAKRNEDATAIFVSITTFNKVAENCAKFLKKGQMVAISGELQESSAYVNKQDGEVKGVTRVTAYMVDFMSPKSENNDLPQGDQSSSCKNSTASGNIERTTTTTSFNPETNDFMDGAIESMPPWY